MLGVTLSAAAIFDKKGAANKVSLVGVHRVCSAVKDLCADQSHQNAKIHKNILQCRWKRLIIRLHRSTKSVT